MGTTSKQGNEILPEMNVLYRFSRRRYKVTISSAFLDSKINIPSLRVVAPPQETCKLKRMLCALIFRLRTYGEYIQYTAYETAVGDMHLGVGPSSYHNSLQQNRTPDLGKWQEIDQPLTRHPLLVKNSRPTVNLTKRLAFGFQFPRSGFYFPEEPACTTDLFLSDSLIPAFPAPALPKKWPLTIPKTRIL